MIKKFLSVTVLFLIGITITSCSFRVPDMMVLEDLNVTLSIAMDLEDDRYVIYQSIPVFRKDVEEEVSVLSMPAQSMGQARKVISTMGTGKMAEGKLQVLLLGRELLDEGDIICHLDYLYRDPIVPANVRIIAVNGPVKEIMHLDTGNKPRLGAYLKDLVKSGYSDDATVETTLQEFFRQSYDKGITPSISEIKKGDTEIRLTGTALLGNDGRYVTSLDNLESVHLLMLKNELILPMEVSYPTKDIITIYVTDFKRDVRTSYRNGTFIFDVTMSAETVGIREMTVPSGEGENHVLKSKSLDELEKIIAEQIIVHCEQVVEKAQQHQIEPFGFGQFARAQCYDEWKEIEESWPKVFSDAEVNLDIKIKIKEEGVIKK
ncbi:Ger(x)C family spore germination protein [Desulfofalx alkaliphila]|uniref:Ger(x)C family spore germination protein n=1 Tax=Desulfofalx alkaliphila TaxID=105483 RepID=UPI0004E1CCEC|nr:Ger(x)C family spore germination protein [Desulfofalx alkaliphila]